MEAIATEVGTAYLSIVAATQGMTRDIKKAYGQAEQAAGGSGKTAGGGFKSTFLGVVAGNMMTGALRVVGSAAKNAFGGGFDRLMNIEAAKTKLKTMGIDAEAAMKSVDIAVTDTRFAISDAADMAAQLGAAGIKTGTDMERWLSVTADAAQFSNRSFGEMSHVIGDIAMSGRVTGKELRQLPVGVAALSDYLGVSQEEVRKLASEGKISAEDFRNAMEKQIGGLAKNTSDDFATMAANIRTAMNATMANLLEPVLKGLMPIMKAGLGLLKAFRDGVAKPLGQALEGPLVAAGTKVAGWIDGLTALLTGGEVKVSGPIRGIAKSFSLMWTDITDVFSGVKNVASTAFDGLRDAVDGFVAGFGGMDTVIDTFKNLIPLVTGPLGILRAALVDMFSGGGGAIDFHAFGESVGAGLKPLLEGLGQLVGVLVGELSGAIAAVLPVLLDMAGVFLSVAGDLVGQLAPVLANLAGALFPLLADIISRVVPVVVNLVSAIAPLIASLVEQLAPIIMDIVGAIIPPLISILDSVVSAVMILVEALMPLVTMLIERLAPIIMNIVGAILPPLVGLFMAVADVIAAVLPPIASLIAILVDMLMPVIEGLLIVVDVVFTMIAGIIGGAMTVIQGIIQVVTGIIKGDWGKVWEGIKTILSGVWDAITAVVGNAMTFIGNIIQAYMNLAKRVWESIWNAIVAFATAVVGRVLAGLSGLAQLGARAAQWVGAFKDAAVRKFTEAVTWIAGIPGRILRAIGNLGNLLKSAGSSLISGFWTGIKNKFNELTSWVSGKMGSLRGLFPFSPAKWGPFSGTGYTTYSGRALVEDFAKGIAERADLMQDATRDALAGMLVPDASALADATRQAVDGLSDRIGVDVRSRYEAMSVQIPRVSAAAAPGDNIEQLLAQLIAEVRAGQQIVLDGDRLVGATSKRTSQSLANEQHSVDRAGGVYRIGVN